MKRRSIIGWFVVLCGLCGLCSIFGAKLVIQSSSEGFVHDELSSVPECDAALVLGCSQYLSDGRPNLFFRNRIHRTYELYRSGKVKVVIVSGDNGSKEYDEPTAMKAALVGLGVPEGSVYCDYAGFSTLGRVDKLLMSSNTVSFGPNYVSSPRYISIYLGSDPVISPRNILESTRSAFCPRGLDSVVRAKEIFGQEELIVVSQEFHNRRAVYIGQCKGMKLHGLNAKDVVLRHSIKTRLRESLARVKTVLDIWVLNRKPRFLGETIHVG